MMAFGSMHVGAYGTLAQVLLVQWLGSIFDLYAYLKTKNVFVSYIAHLLFDFIPFFLEAILILVGVVIKIFSIMLWVWFRFFKSCELKIIEQTSKAFL